MLNRSSNNPLLLPGLLRRATFTVFAIVLLVTPANSADSLQAAIAGWLNPVSPVSDQPEEDEEGPVKSVSVPVARRRLWVVQPAALGPLLTRRPVLLVARRAVPVPPRPYLHLPNGVGVPLRC